MEEDQLTEIAADAPTKGAAPGDQKSEKLPGEVQDMGPAVVSPDATTDPGDAATKKAKKATPPGSAGGKGLPSNAKATAQGDGSGPMAVGAREEHRSRGRGSYCRGRSGRGDNRRAYFFNGFL